MMTSGDYFSGIILPPFADLFPKTISICQTAKFPAILIFAAFPALLPDYCAARYRTSIEKVSGRNAVFRPSFRTSFHTSSHAAFRAAALFPRLFPHIIPPSNLHVRFPREGKSKQRVPRFFSVFCPGPDSLALGHPLFFGLKKSPALHIR